MAKVELRNWMLYLRRPSFGQFLFILVIFFYRLWSIFGGILDHFSWIIVVFVVVSLIKFLRKYSFKCKQEIHSFLFSIANCYDLLYSNVFVKALIGNISVFLNVIIESFFKLVVLPNPFQLDRLCKAPDNSITRNPSRISFSIESVSISVCLWWVFVPGNSGAYLA